MAKAKPKAAEAPAQAAATVDMATLAQIVKATADGGYLNVSDAISAPMLAAGLVEVNEDPQFRDAAGNKATRATAQGIEMTNAQTQTAPAGASTGAAPVAEKPKFTIVTTVPVPESVRKGVARTEQYPFSELPVGGSFFIAATEKKPEPARSYASTVASARNRYGSNDPSGATHINKRTKQPVPNKVYERDFVIRAMGDGAAYGSPGVKGAAVFRTK